MEKLDQITHDTLLEGQIQLLQPKHGYRVAIDPIFLAASIPVLPQEKVLDIGTGVGAAALCVAKRVPQSQVVGLELQWEMVRLAAKNVELNHLKGQVEILNGDLMQPPPRLAPSSFNHVMANPPYYLQESGTVSPLFSKQVAHTMPEGQDSLRNWINFACLMVRPKGSVTFIYPSHHLENLLVLLQGKLGCLTLYPLWPKDRKPAKRFLVRGIKNVQGPTQFLRGLILHDAQGKFTPEAEAILRQGAALSF